MSIKVVVEQYCPATVRVGGKVHLGRIRNGLCYAVCTAAHHGLILPVSGREVDCIRCLGIMKEHGLKVNVVYELAVKR